MSTVRFNSLILGSLISCSSGISEQHYPEKRIGAIRDIPLPHGFSKVVAVSESFGFYLRELAIKQDDTVRLYNGLPKFDQSLHYAVVQIDVGKRNLQQCADAAIRLRAEYLFKLERFDEISFHFTSGHKVSWLDYAKGMRPRIQGNDVSFSKSAVPDSTYASFRKYLDLIFMYYGTASIQRDVKQVGADLEPGMIYLESKRPYGHTVMVMDVAVDTAGNKVFLLAQSYMPAQSIHLLRNVQNPGLSPWFAQNDSMPLHTPQWIFPACSRYQWK